MCGAVAIMRKCVLMDITQKGLMARILILFGLLLEALFFGYGSTIRRTEKELSVVTTCFGFACRDEIRIAEDRIQTVECYYGYRSSPYIRVRLKDGRKIFLTWLRRPMYHEHEIAARVNALSKDGVDGVSVYPLWWALVLGCVLLLFGVAASLGGVRVITEKEWRRKCDVLNLWNARKKKG